MAFRQIYFSSELVFLCASFNRKYTLRKPCWKILFLQWSQWCWRRRRVLWRLNDPLGWCPLCKSHSPHTHYAPTRGASHSSLGSHGESNVGSNISNKRYLCIVKCSQFDDLKLKVRSLWISTFQILVANKTACCYCTPDTLIVML